MGFTQEVIMDKSTDQSNKPAAEIKSDSITEPKTDAKPAVQEAPKQETPRQAAPASAEKNDGKKS